MVWLVCWSICPLLVDNSFISVSWGVLGDLDCLVLAHWRESWPIGEESDFDPYCDLNYCIYPSSLKLCVCV